MDVYIEDYYTVHSGGNAIRGFYGQSQSCDGVISGAGDTRTGQYTLTSDNIFVASTSAVAFTGTAPQTDGCRWKTRTTKIWQAKEV